MRNNSKSNFTQSQINERLCANTSQYIGYDKDGNKKLVMIHSIYPNNIGQTNSINIQGNANVVIQSRNNNTRDFISEDMINAFKKELSSYFHADIHVFLENI